MKHLESFISEFTFKPKKNIREQNTYQGLYELYHVALGCFWHQMPHTQIQVSQWTCQMSLLVPSQL